MGFGHTKHNNNNNIDNNIDDDDDDDNLVCFVLSYIKYLIYEIRGVCGRVVRVLHLPLTAVAWTLAFYHVSE